MVHSTTTLMTNTTTQAAIQRPAAQNTPLFLLRFLLLFLAIGAIPVAAWAGTSQTFGDYTIYYSAFTSDTLQPAVAKTYGITRSKNLGLLSVSVVKKSLSPLGMFTPFPHSAWQLIPGHH